MEKSANTIGQAKFTKLSPQRQHKLLATLAVEAIEQNEFEGFFRRYDELHGWTDIDRYRPPVWLEPAEAAHACRDFHLARAGATVKTPAATGEKLPWQPKFPVRIAVDHVRSPHNLGSILRLCDNFGFDGVIQGPPWHDLDHPRLRRSARGCENWIPVDRVDDLKTALAEAGVPIYALETGKGAISIENWRPARTCILLAGNESYGIAKNLLELCDQRITIPMHGHKASMNVHQALAIAAHAYTQFQH